MTTPKQKPKNTLEYIKEYPHWEKELQALNNIISNTTLKATIKWGTPTFCLENKNVLSIGAFKSYVGLWFYNGSLLKDEASVLLNAQEGKTVALRQWRFQSINEITSQSKLIHSYILEAITNQKDEKEAFIPKKKEITSPLLEKELKNNTLLLEHFNTFSIAKQREFHEYILEAKRITTKESRLKKITPLVLRGEGLHDKYKK